MEEMEKMVSVIETQASEIKGLKDALAQQGKELAELASQVRGNKAAEPYKRGDFQHFVELLKREGRL